MGGTAQTQKAGAPLCAKYGIYAASRMLRHANIRVTAQHYLGTKERTPIGLGNLLAMPDNVTPIARSGPGNRAAIVFFISVMSKSSCFRNGAAHRD